MNDDPEKTLRLKLIAKNFAQHAFINKGNSQLLLYPESQSEDEYEYDPMNEKKKGKEVNVVSKDEVEVAGESIMMDDPNKLDLINHINSLKLLDISQAFDR